MKLSVVRNVAKGMSTLMTGNGVRSTRESATSAVLITSLPAASTKLPAIPRPPLFLWCEEVTDSCSYSSQGHLSVLLSVLSVFPYPFPT